MGRLKSNPNEPWGMGAGQPAPEPSGFLPSDRRLRIDVMLKNETNRCLEELRALASRREGAGSTHGPTRRMLVVGRFRSHGWRVPIGRPVTRSARGGFTLVEMLTVIAIVAVLATLLASGLSAAKRKGRKPVKARKAADKPGNVVSIMDALRRSIEAEGGGKGKRRGR